MNSQHVANEVLRVLKGERRKYTARLNLPDGNVVEWQSDKSPKLDYNDAARALWLVESAGEYGNNYPIMAWVEGSILLVEENPKP
jgi:hypothetical protein